MKRGSFNRRSLLPRALALLTVLVLSGCGGAPQAEAPSADGNRMPADVQADMQKRMGGVSGPPPKAGSANPGTLYPAAGPGSKAGAPGTPIGPK